MHYHYSKMEAIARHESDLPSVVYREKIYRFNMHTPKAISNFFSHFKGIIASAYFSEFFDVFRIYFSPRLETSLKLSMDFLDEWIVEVNLSMSQC